MTTPQDEKVAKQVTGEDLEIMLTEWEQPLVIDAYATWYVRRSFGVFCLFWISLSHTHIHFPMVANLGLSLRRRRCGPCLLMAPEFEAAAKELQGKVRFVKLDTDKEESMAARLNIMGLPTLLFLDKYAPAKGEEVQEGAKAVLKGRIEGALRKENIMDLCEYHFFDGPTPSL